MEEQTNSIESLFERVVAYGNTSAALIKLKTLDKSADVISTLMPRLCIGIIASVFVLILSIGIALWLGDVLGKSYDGFFIVAGFYLVIAIVLYFMRKHIKNRVSTSIITQTLN